MALRVNTTEKQKPAGATNMLTYITTVYNDEAYLSHIQEMLTECKDDRLKVIIVDDYSDQPIEPIVKAWNDPRVSLYRVTEDKGFNSHGARNLAMQHTTTEWNLLVDIDYKIVGIQSIIDQIVENELEPNTVHFMGVIHAYEDKLPYIRETSPSRASINDFLVTKTLYWKAKGYDSEFIGFHFGDRAFIERMIELGPRPTEVFLSLLFDVHLEALRSPFSETYHDPRIQRVTDEKFSGDRKRLYVHPDSTLELQSRELQVKEKHIKNESTDPTPFTWEQQL